MRNAAWLSAEQSGSIYRSSDVDSSLESVNGTGEDSIHFANCSMSTKNLKETVVMSIHTGRIYYVADTLVNTSAESPFDFNTDGASSKYSSFADYFKKKYGIVLFYPRQPLLLLKQTHNPFNLLSDTQACALHRKMLSSGNSPGLKRQNHVHMPPELLVCIDIQVSLIRAFYLIPSLIHRMESLMLACQLREEIAYSFGNINIPGSLILEALTTLRCCEDFSSERLELLGDSVLKYAVSCHLYLKYPQKHEGKLSGQRQRTICNANLHELGINRRLHEYIRDSAFEPRRWVAPGQASVHLVPCSHGIDTSEVPVDKRYQTFDENVILGKSCDRGHRWLVSKGIADCVEAVIGAYYVGGGLVAALHMMKWLGIEVELDPSYVDKAINLASDRSCAEKVDQVTALESKLGYDFSTKGLLLEAITHLTEQVTGVGFCYERLEFLGDAVLDVLITWYLYQNHTNIDPGELTDLRSASVNNENFAQVSVRRNLYQHLQYSSESISKQITEYVTLVRDAEDSKSLHGRQCPKVLGDLLESIAGAILIDTKLNTEELEDILLIGEGVGKTNKAAKGQAALHLLKGMETRGMSYDRCVLKREKKESDDVSSGSENRKFSLIESNCAVELVSHKKQKVSQLACEDNESPDASIPVIGAVSTVMGEQRADKKSSQDSAALFLLYDLEQQGKLIISC
ncbi:Endoribonuclease Dicer-like protein 3b [Bienertia sinuspersici]